MAVVDIDLLGDVAEQKEVEKLASKMKETKKRMSFETLKLIAQSITFRADLLKKIISPVSLHLQKQLTPKLKTRLEMMLHNIALGIECNPSTETSNLFIFVYCLIEDTITGSRSECKENTQSSPDQDGTVGKTFLGLGESGSQNSYILTKFALDLLRNRLKSIKLDKEDEQLVKMLDPFVDLLRKCMRSILNLEFMSWALQIRWLWFKKTYPNRAWASLDDIHIHPNVVALFNIAVESRVGNGRNTLFWEDKWLMGCCLEDLAPAVVAAVPSRTRRQRTVAYALQDHVWH